MVTRFGFSVLRHLARHLMRRMGGIDTFQPMTIERYAYSIGHNSGYQPECEQASSHFENRDFAWHSLMDAQTPVVCQAVAKYLKV